MAVLVVGVRIVGSGKVQPRRLRRQLDGGSDVIGGGSATEEIARRL